MATLGDSYLRSVRARLRLEKELGDGAMAQIGFEDMIWAPDPEANSIATIVEHLRGNMLSRWTDFLTTDGEKSWRTRDAEFEAPPVGSKYEVLARWEEGWSCVLAALDTLTERDLARTVTIRGETLGVIDAINRQFAHYGYHVGQIVYIARLRKGPSWQTLSIARGKSTEYKPSRRG